MASLVSDLTGLLDDVIHTLESSEAGTFEVLSVTLMTNYAQQINGVRRIKANYHDDLSDETTSALDGLLERLEDIDVARQYFKSVYLQDELSSLSRVLLYAGVPAEVISVAVLFAITGGGTPPLKLANVVIPAAAVVGLLPLSLLFAFILRTATVTQRTAATLPFTTPGQEQEH